MHTDLRWVKGGVIIAAVGTVAQLWSVLRGEFPKARGFNYSALFSKLNPPYHNQRVSIIDGLDYLPEKSGTNRFIKE